MESHDKRQAGRMHGKACAESSIEGKQTACMERCMHKS